MPEPSCGPLCECDRVECLKELPIAAWKIVSPRTRAGGDRPLVVATGHRSRGDRLLERRLGFDVLEARPE